MTLRDRLRDGDFVFGTMLCVATSPRLVAVLRELAFDFIAIDLEHAAISRSEMGDLVANIRSAGMAPVVRIPAADPQYARFAMDAGAAGILVPYCETIRQVESVVAAVRLRPIRGQILADIVERGGLAKALRAPTGVDRESLVVIGIESVPALDNLEDLVSVPGIDAVFIGAQDLVASLGCRDLEDRQLAAAFRRIIAACRKRALPVAMFAVDTPTLQRWMTRGVRIVLHMSDVMAFMQGFAHPFAALRAHARRIARS
jgi:2-keto-3-deoxy-L-rhamnonate aldolase RhmA